MTHLKNLLIEHLKSKNILFILDNIDISSKIDLILNECSKINFIKSSVELTTLHILNVSFQLNNQLFVKIGFPLVNNVTDLEYG